MKLNISSIELSKINLPANLVSNPLFSIPAEQKLPDKMLQNLRPIPPEKCQYFLFYANISHEQIPSTFIIGHFQSLLIAGFNRSSQEQI